MTQPRPPCPAPDVCRLYLLRHGATANNDANPPRIQGSRSDPPLSAAGIDQARRTAEFLAHMPIDAVVSSPLLRARQTAEAIAARHQLTVGLDAGLLEIDCGQWEGLTWAEVEARDHNAFVRFSSDPVDNAYRDGENLRMVQQRVVPAIEQLMAAHLGQTIVAVAHNMVNRCFLANHLKMSLADYRRVVQDNCGINLLRFQHGAGRAVTINSVWHLE